MLQVTADRPWPLFDVATTRALEREAAAALPFHTLMQRAGLATARLALAIAPHAKTAWIACGPGNNGGDGLEAAVHLHRWGKPVVLTLSGDPARLPPDAAASWARCQAAGLARAEQPPRDWDLCIDALLGIGNARALEGELAAVVHAINAGPGTVLAVDVPSGLSADTGTGESVRATHTLSLLTLKPGLFTAFGRDRCGQVWFDDLALAAQDERASAWLAGPPPPAARLHASHKGSYGDVAVVGGAAGMVGAAVLAASAALQAGAGRVYLCPLAPLAGALVPGQPELMVRQAAGLPLETMAVACGCGGGADVAGVLPDVLRRAKSLVLDADALNAIAAEPALQHALLRRTERGQATVMTPHPLEAGRLLGCTTGEVQADRIRSATTLAARYGCAVLLKGSGSVIAAPGLDSRLRGNDGDGSSLPGEGMRLPRINPTGNARLATAGTGDVLAGFIAALMAAGAAPANAAAAAAWRHGAVADRWPAGPALTAGALARAL
ncbi:bifunctional ADP-dependent NAD(P)H-hydrate dehydratase/NAD(P)H-hydrate epimerase [Ramlibacter sp. Leaf400]|uniref:bifunctional ADP-dependent NAD(P)H-hydrate dehydratase/NAD(P)H-hydrate epimerase n=1 Tax=Ramlibacter sp. Leaf400 TaxID=1736365 RepID=UPI0007004F9B|nr:bifunctional ADP-dependent NAD(P)H-hydrate dehydratase/NAD(P)H-hydrate epimerase [Ramlibacter sp. Leaf400]KQT07638.1 carbohydrate kinase [Ramlibacter sp. Leaf400]